MTSYNRSRHSHTNEKRGAGHLLKRLRKLGIIDAQPYGGEPGVVVFTVSVTEPGGAVNREGEGVVEWFYELMTDAARADNLANVDLDVPHREVFLVVGSSPPDWPNRSYLEWMEGGRPPALPPQPAHLPQPLTGLWAISSGQRTGVFWSGDAWTFFNGSGEPFDSVWEDEHEPGE